MGRKVHPNHKRSAEGSSVERAGRPSSGSEADDFNGELRMAMPAGMSRQVAAALYGVAMATVIVGVDVAFFRNRFWERLTVNVGIVLVFAAFYLRFLRRP